MRLLRVNALLILVCGIVGALGAWGYALGQPKQYAAEADALVNIAGQDAWTANSLALQKASSFASLAGSQLVADRIQQQLGLDDLGGSVSGWANESSPIIHIHAVSSDPKRAQELANAAVPALGEQVANLEALSAGRENDITPQGQEQAAATTNDADEDGEDETSTPAVPSVQRRLAATQIIALQPAGLPSSPFSPNTTNLIGMGLGGGVLVGLGIAFLRRILDNRVRHNSDVEELLHSSVLAVVPKSSELNAQGRKNVDGLGQAAEAMRHLRTNLRFIDVDHPPRAIVMTSANPGEGKSTVSAVLAQMLAASGQRTILVDTDLRKPVVHKIFEVDGTVGLTQVLAGDVQVSEAAQTIEGQPHLRVIPAGRIPPNPSELLGSQRMKSLLERLSSEAIVILDAPPLLPVTDAGLLAALADGAMVVMEVGGTYKEQAKLCGKILTQVDARLLGVVLNRASRRSLGSVYYGYGYGNYGQSYYYYEGKNEKKLFGVLPMPWRKKRRSSEIASLPDAHTHIDAPVRNSAQTTAALATPPAPAAPVATAPAPQTAPAPPAVQASADSAQSAPAVSSAPVPTSPAAASDDTLAATQSIPPVPSRRSLRDNA